MRTEFDVKRAKIIVANHLLKKDRMTERQTLLLQAMTVALDWVLEEGGNTLELIVQGENIDLSRKKGK